MVAAAVRRLAVLSDVHGNATALEAVLREIDECDVDAIVHCGDLTWGAQPAETLELLRGREVVFVRGNADRIVVELADGVREEEPSEREVWMREHHDASAVALLRTFPSTAEIVVEGVGRVLCSHGSPRNDEECVTERTPEKRLRDALAGVTADIVVTGHIHVRYVRPVLGLTMMSPGSVGMPYEGKQGAFWALIEDGIELRQTAYDVERAVRLHRATGDPRAEAMIEMLLTPPTRDEAIEHAERVEFAG